MTAAAQRVVGIVVLLVAGMLSLPLAAFFFDDPDTENWVIVIQLVAMAAIGAVTGIWWGLLAALVGVLVFWFLLNGLRGA